jgi:uncharacterized membrane protein YraQ (UPF0718 family)
MSSAVLLINVFAVVCLAAAFIKDKAKTGKALTAAAVSFFRILPLVLVIIIIIGLYSAFIPPALIIKFAGEQAGLSGLLAVAGLGAVLHIPALISYPLAAALIENGASVASAAVFITTLTMVGIVTLPLEIKELGLKLALLRNGFSFFAAVLIALIMGMIL